MKSESLISNNLLFLGGFSLSLESTEDALLGFRGFQLNELLMLHLYVIVLTAHERQLN